MRRIALVAEGPGGVNGFAIAFVISPEAELESIAVATDTQRSGVGRVLLAQLAVELCGQGVESLDLEVRESNNSAIAFYLGAGFREIGRRRAYYRDPAEDALLLRMALALG